MSTQVAMKSFALGTQKGRTQHPTDILGGETLLKLRVDDTDGAATILDQNVPLMTGPPLYRHSREDKWGRADHFPDRRSANYNRGRFGICGRWHCTHISELRPSASTDAGDASPSPLSALLARTLFVESRAVHSGPCSNRTAHE